VIAGFMPFPARESNSDGTNIFWFQKTLRIQLPDDD
jgi:hypothetical protein